MWSPPASQGASATCSIEWAGYQNSPAIEYSDTTISVSQPAHISCRPPPLSLAAFWQVTGTTPLAQIIAPSGTIIDVVLSLILYDDDANITQATSSVSTAGILGLVYYLSLDSNATHRFVPVSLATTT